eukprot:CAMPEP_0182423052 /NCGR_PEP_ID=MMETSP1167-20130531/8951_1 /TAXON_ID=2988 /ORGANISM="Mallomonas Sp, Strain CCMP3275" /LENGTH=428 /DNA_ID=CAMNT_0024601669 /DNA_START=1 /DNA_END=1287 /DNA_ORIENTATION=+
MKRVDLVRMLSFPLIHAVRAGDVSLTHRLLKEGADVHYTDESGYTAFMYACQCGEAEIAEMLVQSTGDLSLISHEEGKKAFLIAKQNKNPLIIALFTSLMMVDCAGEGNMPELLRLLHDGVNIDFKDEKGDTALHKAAVSGHVAIIRLLLQEKANYHLQNNEGLTALESARCVGQDSTMALLSFPLILAADSGDEKEFSVWLGRGAWENHVDEYGETALMKAARKGHKGIVNQLMKIRVDTTIKNKEGKTALQLATEANQTSVMSLFPTSLSAAAEGGYLSEVARMIEEGVDVDSTAGDWNNWTPLIRASRSGQAEVVQYLLDKGADVNMMNENKHTALQWAAWNNHVRVAVILLDRGAIINLANENGWTPLICAAWNGNLEMSVLLLDRGAAHGINITDQEGKNALTWARFKDHTEVINLLVSMGAK